MIDHRSHLVLPDGILGFCRVLNWTIVQFRLSKL